MVTVHWIDNDWKLHNIILEFRRFMSLHTGEAAFSFLCDLISNWDQPRRVSGLTTDNASDMVKVVELLRLKLVHETPGAYKDPSFHVLFVFQVIYITLKDCLKLVRKHIDKIRILVSLTDASVKRKDLFDEAIAEIVCKLQLPSMDTETRCSSTLELIRRAYSVLNGVVDRVSELCDNRVLETEWNKAKKSVVFRNTGARGLAMFRVTLRYIQSENTRLRQDAEAVRFNTSLKR